MFERISRVLGAPDNDEARRDAYDRQTVGLEAVTVSSALGVVLIAVPLVALGEGLPVFVWAAVTLVLLPGQLILSRRKLPFTEWMTLQAASEALVGASFGAVAIVAMPHDVAWQAVLASILAASIVGSATMAGELVRLHLCFVVPMTVIAVAGYLLVDTGQAVAMASLLALAGAYSVAIARDQGRLQRELSELSRVNTDAAARLSAERERLERANKSLELANRRLDERTRRDDLTGMANRFALTERLELDLERLRSGEVTSVTAAYLDLDGFKQINDSLGHSAGDRLLQAIATRLGELIEDEEMLARLGGDELTVLSPQHDAELLGRRLLTAFDEPFILDGRRVAAAVSIGLAKATKTMSSDDLLRFADEALYRAKELGGSRFEVFDGPLRDSYAQRRKYDAEIIGALDRGEIRPWLQPIVDFDSGAIIGAEALARWNHPDGVRPASVFIDSVAALGRLDKLTGLVVREIEDLTFQLAELGVHGLRTALNVPPAHLERLLHHFEGSPALEMVIIELTEDSQFASVGRARALVEKARNAGLGIYLDDFGVGFSSLSIATHLAVDGLKIDGSFVNTLKTSEPARAVVASVVDLAKRMDIEVIAEGVETAEQLDILRGLGVCQGQGWVFAPAVPPEEFLGWIRQGRRFDVATTPNQPLQEPSRLEPR